MSDKLTIADFVRRLNESGFTVNDATLFRIIVEMLSNLDLSVEQWLNIYNNAKSVKIRLIAKEKILEKLKEGL
jgi:TnpA family transposase